MISVKLIYSLWCCQCLTNGKPDYNIIYITYTWVLCTLLLWSVFSIRLPLFRERYMSLRVGRRRTFHARMTQHWRHVMYVMTLWLHHSWDDGGWGWGCNIERKRKQLAYREFNLEKNIPWTQGIYEDLRIQDLIMIRRSKKYWWPFNGSKHFSIPRMMSFHNSWIHGGNCLAPNSRRANHTFCIFVHIFYREGLKCIIWDVIPI